MRETALLSTEQPTRVPSGPLAWAAAVLLAAFAVTAGPAEARGFPGSFSELAVPLTPSVVSIFLSAASSARRRFRFAMRRRAAPSDPRSFLATPTLMPWTLNTATHPAAHHAGFRQPAWQAADKPVEKARQYSALGPAGPRPQPFGDSPRCLSTADFLAVCVAQTFSL